DFEIIAMARLQPLALEISLIEAGEIGAACTAGIAGYAAVFTVAVIIAEAAGDDGFSDSLACDAAQQLPAAVHGQRMAIAGADRQAAVVAGGHDCGSAIHDAI